MVVDISTNSPAIAERIRLKGQPTRIALNPKETRLYVTESSSDSVAVINTKTHQVIEEIGTTAPKSVFANNSGFKGSSPNSVAGSPDGGYLYVTNGGANSVSATRYDSDLAIETVQCDLLFYTCEGFSRCHAKRVAAL